MPPRVGGVDEDVEFYSALVNPALMMPGTQLCLPACATLTAIDPAHAAAEHRVRWREHEGVGPELGAHRAEQRLQQPRSPPIWPSRRWRRGHSRTALSVNHPAFSSTRRASSMLRWP